MNQQNTSVVSGSVVDPLASAPFKRDDAGGAKRDVSERVISSAINVSLTVDDIANIGVVGQERLIKERADVNAKAQAQARRTRDGALAAMEKSLVDEAKTHYTTHNATLTNAFNTSEWTFKPSNSFQLVEGRNGAPDDLRVDATVTAKYRGPAESLTGHESALRASFSHSVPQSYYDNKTLATTASTQLRDLEEEGLRIRLELSNLSSHAREAKAAITEAVLRGDDAMKMIEGVKSITPMKALGPAST